MNVLSFLCTVTLWPFLGYLLGLPDTEGLQTQTGHDPFLPLCPRALNSKHQDLIMKLRKLSTDPQKSTSGTCLLYISLLLVTLSHDVQLNPGPRPPKFMWQFQQGCMPKPEQHSVWWLQCLWCLLGVKAWTTSEYMWSPSVVFEESLTVLSTPSKYNVLD